MQPRSMVAFRLAYFVFFVLLGAYGPFMALWLQDWVGLDERATGFALSLVGLTGIVSGLWLARLADRTGQRAVVQRVTAGLGTLILPLWAIVPPEWVPALAIIHGLVWPAQIPLLDAATYEALGDDAHRYGSYRLCGTLGWGVGALVVSAAREEIGIEAILGLQVLAAAGFFLTTLRLPGRPRGEAVAREFVSSRLAGPIWLLLGAAFLHGLGSGHFEMFSAPHLGSMGLGALQIGWVLAMGIVAETLVLQRAPRWLGRYRTVDLTIVATITAALRWALLPVLEGFVPHLLIQASQGLTFGLWYAAALHQLRALVPPGQRTFGQACFAAAFASGMSLGGWLGGHGRMVWGVGPTFLLDAALAVLATCVLLRLRLVLAKPDVR